MNSTDFEIFYNWNNSIKTNDKIQFRTIQAKINSLPNYSNDELEEILIAEGFKHNLIKEALSNSEEKSLEKVVEEASGVPTKYSDVANKFEKVLSEVGPSKFVKMTTSGSSPLIKISSKEKETFQHIVDLAYDNPVHLATLHAYMKPSIVSELAENVCRARKIRSKCSFSKVADGTFKISFGGKVVEASAKPMNSNSEKFITSSYANFNFPDEYIILAHEESSPYAEVKKALNS